MCTAEGRPAVHYWLVAGGQGSGLELQPCGRMCTHILIAAGANICGLECIVAEASIFHARLRGAALEPNAALMNNTRGMW